MLLRIISDAHLFRTCMFYERLPTCMCLIVRSCLWAHTFIRLHMSKLPTQIQNCILDLVTAALRMYEAQFAVVSDTDTYRPYLISFACPCPLPTATDTGRCRRWGSFSQSIRQRKIEQKERKYGKKNVNTDLVVPKIAIGNVTMSR